MSTHNEASPVPLQPPSVEQDNDQSTYHEIEIDTPVLNENAAAGSNPGVLESGRTSVETFRHEHALPAPPTPSKQDEPRFTQSTEAVISSASFQDVPLDAPPPPPIAKSPIPGSDSRPQTPTVFNPSTGRRSTSGTLSLSGNVHGHHRNLTMSKGHTVSVVLISSALETIQSSKEAKRSPQLKASVEHALEMIRAGQGGDRPREIFEPLKLACETRNEKLMIASLDCISKLISYSFFVEQDNLGVMNGPSSPPLSPARAGSSETPRDGQHTTSRHVPLVDLVTHTITACYTETIPDAVSLQIVKALLALVLSSSQAIHHSSLLKAIRTVYNVFLLSPDPVNQTVAQGGLTQMVNHIFSRCNVDAPHADSAENVSASRRGSLPNGSSRRGSMAPSTPETAPLPPITPPHDTVDHNEEGEKATNDSVDSIPNGITPERRGSTDTATLVEGHRENGTYESSHGRDIHPTQPNPQAFESQEPDPIPDADQGGAHSLTLNDLFIKDAYLVFRALCKLTMKPLNDESERDAKSHAMRSKLLSLHLVLTVLNSHTKIFVSPSSVIYSSSSSEATTFINASKQYLCLTISRNAVSPVPQVFDISVELFWKVLSGMRTKLKKEIEVFLHEIYIPILEMKTATLKQKAVILSMLSRLCQDPQALVEIYLNYDCDREAVDNIYEHLINTISKISTAHIIAAQKASEPPTSSSNHTSSKKSMEPSSTFASLSTNSMSSVQIDNNFLGLSDHHLRRQGLECLVDVLRSLVTWGTAARKTAAESAAEATAHANGNGNGTNGVSDAMGSNLSVDMLSPGAGLQESSRVPTPELSDDPGRFESAKQRKTTLMEGIRKFNFKPKKGIEFLIDTGFIASRTPGDIAKFLLHTDGLNKAMIGEYLGEGEEENIAIMHAFVDLLDFTNQIFVDSLRLFLQSFRLPGEAQKIDRFMLKFAERYIANNAQTPFANAEAAYVLSYSTILLNTDLHNPQVKRRMTKPDFVRNNRGINDGQDLPEDLLLAIYDEILTNEIKLKDEVEVATGPPTQGPGIASALANMGRDLQKEAYVMQSHGMANKTEALFRTLMKTRKGPKAGDQFFSASHFVHVKPMFEVAWIPVLAGISGPLQETNDMEIVELCLEGFKHAIRIVCFFDLELERNAFVTTLAKFTFLNNLGEMKAKNMEAIKTLLDVAVNEGNYLKGSWQEVLTCVSQLERMQLISSGIEVPDTHRKGRPRKLPAEELANESRSTHITVAADMVFSLSHYLSGTAIVDFVKALSTVSWEEIQSSGLSEHPRLFSLQKLVEISYYNMGRIRLEWSNLWDILGEYFNQVCCHHNPHVGFFALDALRQLAMRFLEKEELPHFKFQKDFLKPFEHTMIHNDNPDVREMVLQCLQQMIQARAHNMRSGWRAMFGTFSAASRVLTERIVNSSFEIVTRINEDHFAAIVRHGSFADFTVCITEFCKVNRFQKISLLSIAMLRGVIPKMLESPDCALSENHVTDTTAQTGVAPDDPMIKFWFPVLFSFYDIIMNGEDLEVRRLALDSLFSTLKTHGESFPVEFWDTVCQELLFPIFAVLKSSSDLSRWSTQEDMSVWLSTTMIQALRNLIDLYTFFFETLERFLDGLLDLLCVCICQENDTLARIGTSCLQELLQKNVKKLSVSRWDRVITTFVKLFKTTTPHQLFDESLRTEVDGASSDTTDPSDPSGQTIIPAPLSPSERSKETAGMSVVERRRIFKQIIVKCVLQLLLIETTHELLLNDEVYNTIPAEYLLRLMGVLDHSYQFARLFNEDKELRTALWKVGFMKHLPNLLKQETSSAATLVNVLVRMYNDPRPEHQSHRTQVLDRLIPLGLGVIQDFNKLNNETQKKNINAWNPVAAEIVRGFCSLDDKAFGRYLPAIYPQVVHLLNKDMVPPIRISLLDYLIRVGKAQGIVERS